MEDFSHRFSAKQLRIVTDGNVYQRPSPTQPRWLVAWSRGPGDPARFDTMHGLRASTGQERIGRSLDGDPALTHLLKPTSLVKSLVPSTSYCVLPGSPRPSASGPVAATSELGSAEDDGPADHRAEPVNTAAVCTASKSTWIVTCALCGTEMPKV